MLSVKGSDTSSSPASSLSVLSAQIIGSPASSLSVLSAQIIGGNEDLLRQIFVCLPIKSLVRFKSVSKHWLAFITSLKPYSSSPSALFIDKCSRKVNPEFDFVSIGSSHCDAPFEALTFVDDPSGIKILQSCNGLLLCCTFRTLLSGRTYYVYNPLTKTHTVLPPLHDADHVVGVNLAFDPKKSSHYKSSQYKVICIRKLTRRYEIDIYSLEGASWTKSTTKPFSYSGHTLFERGVYCNGAIHWLCCWGDSVYFDVDEEQVKKMPVVLGTRDRTQRFAVYFGESRGHLHFAEIYETQSQLKVFEMCSDFSKWRVKYSVDLNVVANAFPQIIHERVQYLNNLNEIQYVYQILYVGEGETDEDSFLVLHIPNQIIRYDFKDGSFKKLFDFIPDFASFGMEENASNFVLCKAYGFFETLAHV